MEETKDKVGHPGCEILDNGQQQKKYELSQFLQTPKKILNKIKIIHKLEYIKTYVCVLLEKFRIPKEIDIDS